MADLFERLKAAWTNRFGIERARRSCGFPTVQPEHGDRPEFVTELKSHCLDHVTPLALAVAISLFLTTPLQGQAGTADTPPRPPLPEGADTNDAGAYYQLGVQTIEDHPNEAAAAFYWAARLNPTSAHVFYAQRVALLLTDKRRLIDYIERRRSVLESPEMLQIDSLQWRAMQRNPFLYRHLDWVLAVAYAGELVRRDLLRRYAGQFIPRRVLEAEVESFLIRQTDPEILSWRAYQERRFAEAIGHVDKLLEHAEDRVGPLVQRGQIFYMMEQYDSTRTSFAAAIEESRRRDENELVILYESKAILEYGVGFALELVQDRAAAEEAYARALLEDMAFHPAYLRLGALALAAGDTAAALDQFQLAVQIVPLEPLPRLMLGNALHELGRYQDAVAELEILTELEPYYADPYLILGMALETLGDHARAVSAYSDFAHRATADNERQGWVAERIASLKRPPP